ncbi:MAG: formate dehydrogenase accessory sulfurtransferase FdhD [Gemmatimonadetes bacterium]|nr:formate dehydrogenase accessory sulfurtransferase FdhD [Gemmatimonadota bacterium]
MTDLGNLPPAQSRSFTRIDAGVASQDSAAVAEEVPVAFVYGGKPHVVMMCTPADLEDLAVGFTISEEIVARASEIARVDVVRHVRGIEVQMELPPEAQARVGERTRALVGRTGCGLCGIDAIDNAIRAPRVVTSTATFTAAAVARAGEALAAQQPVNAETRAVHAAAFASADGDLRVVREDVGRHNALDKVIGALARAGTPAADGFFVVTSRASYELVQKVAVAGSPLLAAVSRPTGLAIRFAEDAGLTLIGLLRGQSANIYSHPTRIKIDSPPPTPPAV